MKNTLNQLLMLNQKTKNTVNDRLNIYHNIIENIVNEIINGIRRTNTEIHLMYVLIMFYDCNNSFNLMECHYFKMMNILSIVFCVMVDCEITQKYVWQQECLKRETRNAKMQEKCKDNQNNKNNRNNVNGALYFNQCVLNNLLIVSCFNDSNIFLIHVEYCKSDTISTNVQWTNMFKINGNDATKRVDAKFDRILSGNADNIIVSKFLLIPILAFRTTAHNYLFITRCKPFLRLSLSFISVLLLDYVTQLFIELLINTIVIIVMIEMLLSYQLHALSLQMVETIDRIIPSVTHNTVIEFFEYDAASSNYVEREGDFEPGTIMAIDIDIGIVKNGYKYSVATARQPSGTVVTTGIHFANGFNSSLFEYGLQSSGVALFAPHLNSLTVKTEAVENAQEIGW